MLATPSAWAVMASTIIVIRILYLAGIAPSCRIRSRCARYDSANCASRCWSVWIHGGMVDCAISYLLCKHSAHAHTGPYGLGHRPTLHHNPYTLQSGSPDQTVQRPHSPPPADVLSSPSPL